MNLIEKDKVKATDPETNTTSYMDKVSQHQDEVFDITYMHFSMGDDYVECFEDDTEGIVESSNYFTIIRKNAKEILCLRYEDVNTFKFKPKES